MSSFDCSRLAELGTPRSAMPAGGILISLAFPILESAYADPSQWKIEQISLESIDMYRRRFGGKRCNAKIVKYRHAIIAPTFTKIEKHSKS